MKKFLKELIGFANIELFRSFFKTREEKVFLKRCKEFYLQLLKPGDIFFDVGANLGNRIEPLIGEQIKIIAVEPQSKCAKFLKKKYGVKITIVEKGLSDKEGHQEFFISTMHTISSFSKDWVDSVKASKRFPEFEWNTKISVPMTTLDNLIKEFGRPTFIKIDVEGFESIVLKGLSSPIDVISIEYTVPEQNEKVFECLDRIKSISKDILCNYSIGENFEWAFPNWLTYEDMVQHIKSPEFVNTGWGDIYVKSIQKIL